MRAETRIEAEMKRIQLILSAQEVTPEPFRLLPHELAECIHHHAEKAWRAARRQAEKEGSET